MTDQYTAMLWEMRSKNGFHAFGVSKVQRMFGINYNQARTWMDWLIENGHAEPFDDRPWEVRLI